MLIRNFSNIYISIIVLSLTLLFAGWSSDSYGATPDSSQSNDQDISQLYRNYGADGSLVALGVECNQPNDVINKLRAKMVADASIVAEHSGIGFDKKIYQKYFKEGYEQTRKLLLAIQPTPASKRENCMEVDEKIRSRVGR
jgi:hypothetical protein